MSKTWNRLHLFVSLMALLLVKLVTYPSSLLCHPIIYSTSMHGENTARHYFCKVCNTPGQNLLLPVSCTIWDLPIKASNNSRACHSNYLPTKWFKALQCALLQHRYIGQVVSCAKVVYVRKTFTFANNWNFVSCIVFCIYKTLTVLW